MIDPQHETLVSFADAAAVLPRRRGGKKAHVSTVYRWAQAGCRGVILESIQVGGTRCTSHEALARFFEALTYGETAPLRRSPAQRRRAAEAAERELTKAGI